MNRNTLARSAPLGLSLLLALPAVQLHAQETPAPASTTSTSTAAPQAEAEHAAIFKKVQGAVTLRPAADTKAQPRPVASGEALAVGERVHAGKDAGASFTLSDGTELMLGARSSAVVREYAFNSTTQEGNILIEFLGGQLRVISGLISKKNPESLKVQTPSAVVGVRGTDFVLEAPAVDE